MYKKFEKLGEGTFGTAYKAKSQKKGAWVLLKEHCLLQSEEGVPATAIRRIAMLKELNHPNIVRFYDVVWNPGRNRMTLVTEYMDGHQLRHLLQQQRIWQTQIRQQSVIKSYMLQLVSAVHYLHHKGIIHRNLSTHNIMLSDNLQRLKIRDFSNAAMQRAPVKRAQVSNLWCRAPEALLGNRCYSYEVDIWSVGCIFIELLNGSPLFTGINELDQIRAIFAILDPPKVRFAPKLSAMLQQTHGDLWHEDSGETHGKILADEDREQRMRNALHSKIKFSWLLALKLLAKMMRYDGDKRISADSALQHSFFKSDEYLIRIYSEGP